MNLVLLIFLEMILERCLCYFKIISPLTSNAWKCKWFYYEGLCLYSFKVLFKKGFPMENRRTYGFPKHGYSTKFLWQIKEGKTLYFSMKHTRFKSAFRLSQLLSLFLTPSQKTSSSVLQRNHFERGLLVIPYSHQFFMAIKVQRRPDFGSLMWSESNHFSWAHLLHQSFAFSNRSSEKIRFWESYVR